MDGPAAWARLMRMIRKHGDDGGEEGEEEGMDATAIANLVRILLEAESRLALQPYDLDRLLCTVLQRLPPSSDLFDNLLALSFKRLSGVKEKRVKKTGLELDLRRLSLLEQKPSPIPVKQGKPASLILNLYLLRLRQPQCNTELLFDAQSGWFRWLQLVGNEEEGLKYCRMLLRGQADWDYATECRLWQELRDFLSELVEFAPHRFAPFNQCPDFIVASTPETGFLLTAFQGSHHPLARLLLGLQMVRPAEDCLEAVPSSLVGKLATSLLKVGEEHAEWLPVHLQHCGLLDLAWKWLYGLVKQKETFTPKLHLPKGNTSHCQAIATLLTQREAWAAAAHHWEVLGDWERAALCHHRQAPNGLEVRRCLAMAICYAPTSADLLARAVKAQVSLIDEPLTEAQAVFILQHEPVLLRAHSVYAPCARLCLGEEFGFSDKIAPDNTMADTAPGNSALGEVLRIMAKLHNFAIPKAKPEEGPLAMSPIKHAQSMAEWHQQLAGRLQALEHSCWQAHQAEWALDWPEAKHHLKVARDLTVSWNYTRARAVIDARLASIEAMRESILENSNADLCELTIYDGEGEGKAEGHDDYHEERDEFDWLLPIEDCEEHWYGIAEGGWDSLWAGLLKLQALPLWRRCGGSEPLPPLRSKAPLLAYHGGHLLVYSPRFRLRLSLPLDLTRLQTQFQEIMSDNRASLAMGKRCLSKKEEEGKREWWEGRKQLEAKMAAWLREGEVALHASLLQSFCFPGPIKGRRRERLISLGISTAVIAWLETMPAVPKASLLEQLAALIMPNQLRSQAIKQLRLALITDDDEPDADNVFTVNEIAVITESEGGCGLHLSRHLLWLPWEQLWPDLPLERILLTGKPREMPAGVLSPTFLLNPSGDLAHTQQQFLERLSRHRGIVGRRPSPPEMLSLVSDGRPFL